MLVTLSHTAAAGGGQCVLLHCAADLQERGVLLQALCHAGGQDVFTGQVTAAAGIAAAAVEGDAVAGTHAVVAGMGDAVVGTDHTVAGVGDAVAGAGYTVASVGDAVVAGVVDAVAGVGNKLLPCCNGSCLQVWWMHLQHKAFAPESCSMSNTA